MKLTTHTDLYDAVNQWFTQNTSQGEPISGLCEKAIQFNGKVGRPSNFQASWLKQFLSRHGIREKLSDAYSFKFKLRDILKKKIML